MGLFEEATREKAKLRLALTGVSGAGKTLSALYIAYGITGDWGKIALIDTEHRRGKFYAGRSDLPTPTGTYLYAELAPPYSPGRYKQFVQEGAGAVGPDGVVIVDSFSHAWSNEGGILEIKDQYVEEHKTDYYLRWWFANRDETDLLKIAMEEYRKEEAHEIQMGIGPRYSLAADRRDFCNEETYYNDFAKGMDV